MAVHIGQFLEGFLVLKLFKIKKQYENLYVIILRVSVITACIICISHAEKVK
jgi:hypothetical protein